MLEPINWEKINLKVRKIIIYKLRINKFIYSYIYSLLFSALCMLAISLCSSLLSNNNDMINIIGKSIIIFDFLKLVLAS